MNHNKLGTLYSHNLTSFARILPPERITIYPSLEYIDVNDVTPEVRQNTKKSFAHDPEYIVAFNFGGYIPKGNAVNKQYCVYVYRLDSKEYIGSVRFAELLDNPHGYGEGDFLYTKLVFPQYRHTKYSRYMIGDLMYFLFMADLVNNLYTYVPLKEGYNLDDFWMNIVDKEIAPCMSKQYKSDNSQVQKYIIPTQVIPGFKKDYLLLEFNGNIYRTMDHREYLSTVPTRSPKIVDRWLAEMNKGVQEIQEWMRSK